MGLNACPFCGAAAESDLMRPFRRAKDGKMSDGVAIYCTKCSVEMMMCREDFPEYDRADMLTILTEAWNLRTDRRIPDLAMLVTRLCSKTGKCQIRDVALDYLQREKLLPSPLRKLAT